jgi:hypothetical protein
MSNQQNPQSRRHVLSHGRLVEVEIHNPDLPRSKRSQWQKDTFVKVPLEWAIKASKATHTPQAMVWLRILHTAWEIRSNTFPLPSGQLKRDGVDRMSKSRALRNLETVGLITVQWRKRSAPIVTIVTKD